MPARLPRSQRKRQGPNFGQQVDAWAEDAKAGALATFQEACTVLVEAVVTGNRFGTGTPYDTVHTRGSWTAEVNGTPPESVLGVRDPKAAPNSYSPAPALAQIKAAIARLKLGDVLSVANTATPIKKGGQTYPLVYWLNSGAIQPIRASTPPGWVDAAIAQWPAIKRDAALRTMKAAQRKASPTKTIGRRK